MALKHSAQECAKEIVQIGKDNFGWAVGGASLPHQSIQVHWYNDDFGQDELDAGIDYGTKNGWFSVASATRENMSAQFILQPAGDAAA
jgi:hypothetical protein